MSISPTGKLRLRKGHFFPKITQLGRDLSPVAPGGGALTWHGWTAECQFVCVTFLFAKTDLSKILKSFKNVCQTERGAKLLVRGGLQLIFSKGQEETSEVKERACSLRTIRETPPRLPPC